MDLPVQPNTRNECQLISIMFTWICINDHQNNVKYGIKQPNYFIYIFKKSKIHKLVRPSFQRGVTKKKKD